MNRHALLVSLTATLLMCNMQNANAVAFGTFDPRSMAMGGAGVASGTSANASFFNPALLAASRKEEDFSLEFPIIGVRIADPDEFISNLDDFQQAEYVDGFSNAITQWNNATTAGELLTAKGAVVTTGGALVGGLTTLSNKAMQGEFNTGLVIGIPSKKWGAALYIDARAQGGALLDITQGDLNNINAVIDGLNANNTTGLLDGNGDLIDPTSNMTSSVQTRGAVLAEAGVSLAREFSLFGNSLAVGITPKYVRIETFDYAVNVDTADITLDQGKKSYSNVNLDIGVAHDYANGWKTGVVVKNLISKNYTTALGNKLEIKPQARAGLAYSGSVATVAVDVDLAENDPAGFDGATQYVALGAELNAWNLFQFRLGYRHNLSDSDTSSAAVGVGLSPFGVHLDLAAVGGNNELGFGLQTGFRF